MTTMTEPSTRVTGGADTHRDQHVVAALDERGGQLGVRSFPTTEAGYRQALAWLRGFGTVERVGVEGTGSYGAGLSRYLDTEHVVVVEVNRPNRQLRRSHGKSDPVDAVAAARAAQSGEASGAAKTRTGAVEAIRALRVARRSAGHDRTRALGQMRALLVSGPDDLRKALQDLSVSKLVTAAARLRPTDPTTAVGATKLALRELARRVQSLKAECERLDAVLEPLVAATAPDLVACFGVGTDTAGALLVSAGDNPERLRSEAAFAHHCGVAPIDASSGLTTRKRLNRGGDRTANEALWRIVMVRMVYDPRTRAYVERRTRQGRSKKEIIRCLKRYVARQLFRHLPRVESAS
jgi:transposase